MSLPHETLSHFGVHPGALRWLAGGLFLLVVGFAGCKPKTPELAPTKPPEVVVDRPVRKKIQEHEDFTGRTEAYRMTEVRARVSGYLESVHFKEGSDIQEGMVLAEIDPRIYQATVSKSEANMAQAEAHYKRLSSEYRRAERLMSLKTITQEEFDKVAGDRNESLALVEAAKADLALAKLNLGFAKLIAPQSGRIGKRLVDPGNLIKADDTPIATIVSIDPIYASFDIDERTLLRLRKMVRKGEMKSARETDVAVQVGLADEDGFSMDGVIDFVDTVLHPGTGSLRVRALVKNPEKILSPGLFVRIRLPVGEPHEAWMLPEEAMGTDQGNKLVYVLNEKDEVVARRVKQGVLSEGYREITEGLTGSERVIISGLQRVRPGVKVTPKTPGELSPSKSKSPGESRDQPKENPPKDGTKEKPGTEISKPTSPQSDPKTTDAPKKSGPASPEPQRPPHKEKQG